jgi:hypothetical protein
MVLASELAHVTSAVLRVGVLFPHKIKFNLKELHKVKKKLPATESGPTLIALPVSGGRYVRGVTLDDRRAEGQGVSEIS